MGFWIFMFFMDLLLPLTMTLFGKLFLSKAPKDINFLFGYRTEMSMKNKNTWEFAHLYIGRIWYILGMIMLPVSAIPLLFAMGMNTDTVGYTGAAVMFFQLILLIIPIFPTEAALKKTFDEHGRRRQPPDQL